MQCNLDLLDVNSNFQRFKKVIDLKVNKRTQSSRRHRRNQGKRRRNQLSLYGGDEYGSGDGFGDGGEEVSRSFKTMRRKEKICLLSYIIHFPRFHHN